MSAARDGVGDGADGGSPSSAGQGSEGRAVGAEDVLSVVRGSATPEEVAALVGAIVSVRQGAAPPEDEHGAPAAGSRWASREAALRPAVHPGPGAWAAAAWRR